MPENWVELALALIIAGVCLGVPLLVFLVVMNILNRKR
jgi:hypothetical protein